MLSSEWLCLVSPGSGGAGSRDWLVEGSQEQGLGASACKKEGRGWAGLRKALSWGRS